MFTITIRKFNRDMDTIVAISAASIPALSRKVKDWANCNLNLPSELEEWYFIVNSNNEYIHCKQGIDLCKGYFKLSSINAPNFA